MKKKYLIVGLDRYYNNNYPTTVGAVNSAISWKYILEGKGFLGNILLNEFATAESILAEFEKLITNLEKGDFACFIYIGHGGKFKNKAEPDERDELLYPYFSHIKDDDLRKILDKNDKNVPILILLDCCENGVDEMVLQIDETKNEIVISASSKNKDMELDEIIGSRQAVFSYFTQNVILENNNIDYEKMINLINEKISETKYEQRPKLIYSNVYFLKTKIFNGAIDHSIKFDEEFFTELGNNNDISQGQLKHTADGLFLETRALDLSLKDQTFKNKTLKNTTTITTKNKY